MVLLRTWFNNGLTNIKEVNWIISVYLWTVFKVHVLLPPGTKLGQSYIFTGVCHSVNRGRGPGPGEDVWSKGGSGPGGGVWSGGVSAVRGVWSGGVSGLGGCLLWGGCLVLGGVWSGGVAGARGFALRGMCLVDTPRDGHCCGRYASYWNAFLLVLELLTYHRFSSKPFGLFLDIKFFFVIFKIDLVKFYHKIFAELLTVPNENDYFKIWVCLISYKIPFFS